MSVLLQLGNLLGKAIKVDDTTMNVERGKYARVCVEIYLKKPLASRICLNGASFAMEYEGLSTTCFKCGRYGHTSDDCGKEAMGEVPVAEMSFIREWWT